MKLAPLPALTRGVDVLTPEGDLTKGAVRKAVNISIHDNGSFDRRPGYRAFISLADAHSLWRSPAQTRVLVAAGDTLYDVDLGLGSAGTLFVGLTPGNAVEYTEVGPDIYFVDGNILRRVNSSGMLRRPGVAALGAERPSLAQGVGGLTPGRYGVAYSLLNDTGEESGLSDTEWIDVTGGGIGISAMATAPNVTQVNVYVTSPNGGELYLHQTLAQSSTASISDKTQLRTATNQYLAPMPGGDYVRYFRGRLYVVSGSWVWYSEPLYYGLTDVRSGFLTFGRTITMFEPVESGIFVGLREKVLFLRGNGPESFQEVPCTDRGAIAHTGTRVAADFFSPELVPDRGFPVATWLSERGMAVGRADGSLALPQAERISLVADRGRVLFLQHAGIKQAIYCVESLTLGSGGTLLTDFSFISAAGRSIADSDARGRSSKIYNSATVSAAGSSTAVAFSSSTADAAASAAGSSTAVAFSSSLADADALAEGVSAVDGIGSP